MGASARSVGAQGMGGGDRVEERDATEERSAALVFLMAHGVGVATANRLRQRHGSLAGALKAVRSRRERLPFAKIRAIDRAVENRGWVQQLAAARDAGARYVTACEPAWANPLTAIARPPVGLFVRGTDPAVLTPMLAIVGTRAPSPRGRLLARELAASLSVAGLTIVSGLARGIDSAAHQGALDAGGPTVAVLGSGLDRVYPAENLGLARRIAETGAVLSEFPFGTDPRPEHFPMRNRIVAGLSAGVLVIEAAERSGALITASFALEEGREVFAVPGPPNDLRSRGPNGLIKSGAKLVESAADVLVEIETAWGPFGVGDTRSPRGGAELGSGQSSKQPSKQPNERPGSPETAGSAARVRAFLTQTPVSAEELAGIMRVPVRSVLEDIVELELAGLVKIWPGGRYTRP
ncbi:DNA-processing protein DprA [bacterium]|nr:DNA-processing protein DprA [bacterium]